MPSRPRGRAPPDGHQHIVASEYGRALEAYLRLYSREQLFVGSVTVMDRDPMALLGDLWRFLGVDDSHVPPNLGTRYQVRGTGRRIPVIAAVPRIVKGTPGLRHAWHALPERARVGARARFRTLAEHQDQRKPVGDERMWEEPDPALVERLRQHFAALVERLRQHFAEDTKLLEELVGPVPGVTDRA